MWEEILNALETGEVRSAHKKGSEWVANTKVKQEILNAFKAGQLVEHQGFVDKHNLLPQTFTTGKNVRVVPGGSSVRRGAYVAPGVIIMPPSYINIGAFVDEGTMVDSHVLVGSCAQIGKRVHLSAGVQIGGVLEPIGQIPVIIEDDAFIGAGCVIVEGILVKSKAVLAPGVILSRGIPVYDCVNERMLDRGEPIPEMAVVVSGTRPVSSQNKWASDLNLQMRCALIVKYRDANSETSLELESILR
jgi:2,3,4,5-tetrahydropyridine-2-carboxylate N-succinyltransferase